jgi:hypothetical protein
MQQQNVPIGTLVDMYKRGEIGSLKFSATTYGKQREFAIFWTHFAVDTLAARSSCGKQTSEPGSLDELLQFHAPITSKISADRSRKPGLKGLF